MFLLKFYVRLKDSVLDVEGKTIKDVLLKSNFLQNDNFLIDDLTGDKKISKDIIKKFNYDDTFSIRRGKIFDIKINVDDRNIADRIAVVIAKFLVKDIIEDYSYELEEIDL